ncbi:MAG: DUF447 family protein [Gammaproteobacteria bacterium]
MIFEGIITTQTTDGGAHVTPMGFRRHGDMLEVAPFRPSQTLDNLLARPHAVMNLVDDVRIVAGCLTGRRDWPVVAARTVPGWRLAACLCHLELAVAHCADDGERPRFRLAIVAEDMHRPFRGFNRAQAAVVEAAILVSRLDFIDPAKLAGEMAYLHIAVSKTAGDAEREAWQWLVAAIAAHPRHALDPGTLAVA